MTRSAPNPGEAVPEPKLRSLRLEAIAGPALDPIVLVPGDPAVLGRSSNVDHQLSDKTISRRHCRILRRGINWLLTDLESRHGTYLNGIKLAPEQPAPLNDGDLIRVGPWTLRVIDDADRSTSLPTTNDLATTSHRVQRVPVRELRSVAQQRLDLLIECAAGINAASSERELGERALAAVTQGTGFRRAAFIRQVSASGDVQVLAAVTPESTADIEAGDTPFIDPAKGFSFSRSLINAASSGEIVRMTNDSNANYGESIIRLGISSALCAPITLGSSVEAYIYLDARESGDAVAQDAAAFCQAVSRMCGLALANLKRIDLEKKSADMRKEIEAAREAQVRLMPTPSAQIGAFAYAMINKPGSTVAGDLFDVVELSENRLAFFLGDVMGKGSGAAILMATIQAGLRASLMHGDAPHEAILHANASACARSGDGEFLSLFLGVLDRETGTLEFVDAGHGHWMIAGPDGARRIECEGGHLLGIEPAATYRTETCPLPPGARVLAYSDGLIEQPSPEGEQFGYDRAAEVLATSSSPGDDVEKLATALSEHAGTDRYADDLTIASVAILKD
jgi:sigma-B regulation protein RsbU (phosphoserine phosphatase)